ncbi:hypothetical protein [Catellatospora vulcania]|uniref:hypothetical protein n=1 Tax=Catellatospora vulcania TaxID=1460450 RepID=UPI0012D4C250|nr:hypothetical protein [Catellatospora vulcania]
MDQARARTERLVARLREVTWEEDLARNGSRIALMQEYLRRSALWARALDRADQWPFFDIAAAVDPSARLDEEFVGSVLDGLEGRGLRPLDRRVIRYMLDFSALPAWPANLPDPFDPLLAVYERGGSFSRSAGSIRIGVGDGVPARRLASHARRAPAEELGPAALDALDRAWEEHRAEVARRVRAAGQLPGG